MGFEESSVIISGGSKGIGLSIAKVFARQTKHPLVLIARNQEELQQAKEECINEGAHQVEILSADITNDEVLSKIDFSLYNPGILINNAGSFLFKGLKETSKKQFNSQFQINTLGAFNLTKAVLSELEQRERALIVNISSMGALKGLGGSGAYSMSKHALLGYTRSLRKELMNTKVAVTAINLGQTYSTSWHEVDIDPNKLIDPEDVGKLIISLSELSARSVAEEISLMPQGGEVKPI
ncbi:MAG: SDR family NAD(P)-dependent oxidoreductase [Gracilimonas sp.]|uniref:SDR family NAD(P)-dependent oxidoreductase n=1 Tax=Gracilimonas sp. TaxID=1974203 RepID=UPI0019AFCE11|nr:SDR family NAD(P)-dependent oxidoreductase [Gracilimonas sp.]MBD3615690.1 SDR family NAD(P)-dependent oxidoreductase [Gracilimonas sp.]